MKPMVRMVCTLSIAVAALVCVTPRVAEARPCCSNEFTYFSDCSFTEVVGYDAIDCSGHHTQWGITTSAVYVSHEWCNNSSCCAEPPCDYWCQAENFYSCGL